MSRPSEPFPTDAPETGTTALSSDGVRPAVTGVVLAGGRGQRLGGEDKGWVEVAGRPLIVRVLEALRPQVDALLINANRSQDRYRALGVPVIGDTLEGFAGPLSGIASALSSAVTPLVLVVPCDGPALPPDLLPRLRRALLDAGAEIAVAHDGEQLQPTHALLRRELRAELLASLAGGVRAIHRWYAGHHTVEVDFSDHRECFRNVNTETDRQALEQALRTRER